MFCTDTDTGTEHVCCMLVRTYVCMYVCMHLFSISIDGHGERGGGERERRSNN